MAMWEENLHAGGKWEILLWAWQGVKYKNIIVSKIEWLINKECKQTVVKLLLIAYALKTVFI